MYIKNWADIILQARRTHYITEPINTIIEYLGKKGVQCHIDSIDLRKFNL